jgi:hypothetical protein
VILKGLTRNSNSRFAIRTERAGFRTWRVEGHEF